MLALAASVVGYAPPIGPAGTSSSAVSTVIRAPLPVPARARRISGSGGGSAKVIERNVPTLPGLGLEVCELCCVQL